MIDVVCKMQLDELPNIESLIYDGQRYSEHAFAVFLSLIRNGEQSARELGEALAATVLTLEQWTAEIKLTYLVTRWTDRLWSRPSD